MRPVLVTNAGHPGAAALRVEPDDFRPDDVIDELGDLLALVGAPDAMIVHACDESVARRSLADGAASA